MRMSAVCGINRCQKIDQGNGEEVFDDD